MHARFVVLAWRANQLGYSRCGVVVPRFQRTAVARNRVRRRLREIARRGPLASLPSVDLVLRARNTAFDAAFAALQADVTEALARVR